jgi:hypothetical protein
MIGRVKYQTGSLILALAVAAVPLQAQRGQGVGGEAFRGPGGPNLGRSLELALENREELELSQEQLTQLQELKQIIDEDVAGLAEEMKALRESIRSGEVGRDEGMRRMQALQGEFLTASAPLTGRVREILTVEQHGKLQPLVRRGRVGRVGAGAVRGRGMSTFRGRGMGTFRGAAPGAGRGPVGGKVLQSQPGGFRCGVGLRQGVYGQGRAPAFGFRQGFSAGRGMRRGGFAPDPWGAPGSGFSAPSGEGVFLP